MIRFLLALLLLFPLAGFGQERALRPIIEPGDSWTYRGTNTLGAGAQDYTIRVDFADEKTVLVVVTRKSDGKEFDSTWTREWNSVSSYTRRIARPSTGFLKFPMQVGDTHELEFDAFNTNSSDVTNNAARSKVVGWEEIEVPAGKFRVMRIEVNIDWIDRRTNGRGKARGTFWYSPEVRRWVRSEYVTGNGTKIEEVLLDYKLQ